MLYCSREHQTVDRANHKSACNAVKKSRDRYEHEEHALRAMPADVMMPADVFTNEVGHFWGILGTRDYMRARYDLVEAIIKIKTFDAVNVSLDHLMDMLRLCRTDNLGLRDVVPAMFLRLGRDQKCYDFVKWWQSTGNESNYSFSDLSLPYLDITSANSFEPVGYMCSSKYLDLSHNTATALLKIKLLQDLKALQTSFALRKKIPREIVDNIQRYIPQSSIISGDKDIMSRADHTSEIEKLSNQVKVLYMAIENANQYWWKVLLNAKKHLKARPAAWSPGSLEQAQMILYFSYDAWAENPGALDMIRQLRAKV